MLYFGYGFELTLHVNINGLIEISNWGALKLLLWPRVIFHMDKMKKKINSKINSFL
jgi:hypothetical protein